MLLLPVTCIFSLTKMFPFFFLHDWSHLVKKPDIKNLHHQIMNSLYFLSIGIFKTHIQLIGNALVLWKFAYQMYKHKPNKVLSLWTNLALRLESQPSENSALCNRFSHLHGRNVKCPSCRTLLFIFLALGSFLQQNFGIVFN